MQNTATNITCNSTSGTSLRPETKPVAHKISTAFRLAFPKEFVQELISGMERVFLRLGFDRYIGERGTNGMQVRLAGHHIVSGKYNDYHVVYRNQVNPPTDIVIDAADKGNHYNINYRLSSES